MKRIVTIEDGFARDAQVFTGDPKKLETDGEWRDDYVDMKYTNLYLGIYEGDTEDDIRIKAAEKEGVRPDILTIMSFESEINMDLLISRDNIQVDREFICKENEVKVYIEVWFDPEKKFGITLMGDDCLNVYAYISSIDVRLTYVIRRADGTVEDEKTYEQLADAEKSLIREMADDESYDTSGRTLIELFEECERKNR